MMHKEVVGRRRAPVIAIVLFVITFMLYVHEGLKHIDFDSNKTLLILNLIVLFLTLYIIIKEYRSCKVYYKYAIIANKLIINKISGESEDNLISVKINDIAYIGSKAGESKKYNARSIGHFMCEKLRPGHCCVYEKDGKYYKFNFKPSNSFIDRVKKYMVK
ncbi:hypothetical protein [Clostridium chrysemydis]|uniref:hypothetical protein n=1 Tax=Clostridium chrysemydis TaxID=2665504 RepID=UPI003F3C7224